MQQPKVYPKLVSRRDQCSSPKCTETACNVSFPNVSSLQTRLWFVRVLPGLCVIGPDSSERCIEALHYSSVVVGYVELLR